MSPRPTSTNGSLRGVTERALADGLMRLAHRALGSNNVKSALALARRAVRTYPDAPRLLDLGALLYEAGRATEAVEAIGAAAAMTVGQLPADSRYVEGMSLAQLGQVDRAEAVLRIAVALQPKHSGATYALASLLACRGAFEEADAFFARDLPVRSGDGKFTWTRCIRLPLPGRPLGAEAPATAVPPGRRLRFGSSSNIAGAKLAGRRAVYAVAADLPISANSPGHWHRRWPGRAGKDCCSICT